MSNKQNSTGIEIVTKEFVTIGDASEILGVSIDTIRRWERAGKLHSKRLDGKNRYFDVEELHQFVSVQPLSTTEVATILRVSPSTVRRLEQQGLIASTRDKNGKRQYNKQTIQKYLNEPSPQTEQEPIQEFAPGRLTQQHEMAYAEVEPVPSITNKTSLSHHVKKVHDKTKQHVGGWKEYIGHKLPGQVPKSLQYTGTGIIGLVLLFATLFLMFPTQMNNNFGYKSKDSDSPAGEVSPWLVPFKPFATAGRTIAGVFDNEGQTINVANINNTIKDDGNGTLVSQVPVSVPSTSYIKIPDSEQIDNLNSEYVGGFKPGNQDGNLAVLPITSDKVRDKSLNGVDLADGTIQLTNLSPALQALINGHTTGGGVSGSQGPAGPAGPQGAQGPQGPSGGGIANVTAGSGLLGGGSSASISLQVDVGDSIQIISNGVEVKLAVSGSTSTTSSNSGLEITSQGLRLIGGCSNGQILKWNGSAWACATDSGGGGSLDVQTSDGGTFVSGASNIQFGPTSSSTDEFTLTNLGAGQLRVRLGTNVLLSSNFATVLDPIYANATETPAAGDITGSFNSGFFVAADAVGLGTDTTGNYVATIGGSAGLAVTGSGSENAGVTIALDVSTTGTTATISGNSGLEEGPDGLRLLGGCGANQILKWNGTAWLCSADNSSSLSIEENDSQLLASATALDFLGSDFAVSTSIGEADVAIDYANSGITRRTQTEVITGGWSFNDSSFTLRDNSDISKQAIFELSAIGTGTTRTLSVPNASGILVTTGNLSDITATGTVTSGTWQGSNIAAQYGGTGINGASAANGSLLIGNGSGYSLAGLTQGSGVTVTNGVGSITIAATLGTSIANAEIDADAVTLGTQTTGNYVASISGSTGISVSGSGSESAATSLTLDVTTTGTTGTTNANSGLELGPDGLRLVGGCGNNEILKWNGSAWACAADANSGSLSAQEGDVTVSAAINTLDYLANDFDVTETPAGEANISIDYTNTGITRAGQAATITGSWLFTDNAFTVRDNTDTSKQLVLQLSGISTATTRTLTAPDASGTLITSGNLSDITSVGTITAGTWNGTVISDTYISDTLSIGASSTVADGALSGNVTKLGSAIDLSTAEVSGNLRATNLQNAGMDLGAANVTIDLTNTNSGGFVTNLTTDGTITATSIVGTLTGNASTATALAANPTDCSVNQFANAIAANGDLSCASITDADVSNTLTASLFVGSGSSTNAIDLSTAEVAGVLGASNGGTGVNGGSAANGQLLIGNGSGYALATLGQGNGISITNGAGSISVAAVIESGKGLQLDGNGISIMDCSTGEVLKYNGSNQWACGADNGTGSAPTLDDGYGNDPNGSNVLINLTSADGALLIRDNATPLGSTLFAIQNSAGGTSYFDVTTSGISTTGTINGLTVSSGTITAGTWNGTALNDTYVSDTLTASIFIGSGSTTNAIDLATAEIAGNLKATNLQSAAADLGAANVTIDLGNTNGSFVTNLTIDGTITAVTFVGALTGNSSTATALAANPVDCSTNQFANAIAANGDLSCTGLTDADVSDTLTASILVGTGSTTNAVDLATAEISGNLRAVNLQSAGADLGAANVNIDLSNTNGSFVTNLTTDGTITAINFSGTLSGNATSATSLAANPADCAVNSFATTIAASGNLTCASIAANNLPNAAADLGAADVNINLGNTNGSFNTNLILDGVITATSFSGTLTGNASTASALAANPTDCSANQFATTIAASGNLGCAALTDTDIPNNITIDLATAATALQSNPSDCSVNQFATTIAANGNLTCAALTDADIPDSITVTLAATATALAANPSDCAANSFATTIAASGNLTCASIAANNLPNAAADLGAANITIDLGNTNGSFVTNLTTDGIITAATFSGALSGNATTATALAANPTDCATNQFATTIASNGNLTCASITDADVPNNITIDLAAAATALQSNPTDCAANQFANAIAASGNLTCASITDSDVSDTLTASIFIGSGSTTDAIDLATAEVAGILGSSNISGSYTGITGTGALNAGSITSGFGSIDTGVDNITTTGTVGTASQTTFTGASGTFSGTLSAASTKFNVNTDGDITSTFTALDGSTLANGGSGIFAATSLVVDDETNFNVGNYVRVTSTDCSGTVDICYAKITAINTGANTLTITPALLWDDNSAVDEFHIPEVGGADTTSTLANRYGRGYFIAGVLTGNGTTYYGENGIESSLTRFDLLNTTITTLNIGGAATAVNLGVNGGMVNVLGGLSVAQAFSSVGVNAGSGLLQGTGGLTIVGTTSINTTGTANTTIGNATGTFELASSALDVTTAGAVSGVSSLSLSGAISGGTTITSSGNINTTGGALQLNGADINTAGTLTNVAYENQANTFTQTNTFSGVLAADNSITSTQASFVINAAGTVDIQDSLTVDSLTADTGGISIAAGQSYTGAGAVTLSSAAATALMVDSGTTGALNIGTSANAKTITIGNSTGATSLTLTAGSGNIILGSGTLQRTAAGTTTLDLIDPGATTLAITNSGAGVASLTIDGAISASGGITNTNTLTSVNNTNLALNAQGTGNIVLTGYNCSGQSNGGALTTDAAGVVSCSADDSGLSDARLKENVTNLDDDILDRLKNVHTVTFNYDCDHEFFTTSNFSCDSNTRTGVIAQELEQVFPELVYTAEDGYKRVNYNALNIYTLKSIVELSSMVDEVMQLKDRVDTLEDKVAVLEENVGANSSGGQVTIDDLVAGQLSVTVNIFTQGMMTVAGSADFRGDAFFQSLVTFGNTVVFNGEVNLNNKVNFTNNTGGYANFNAGQQTIHVSFAVPYSQPPVISISLGNGKFARYSQSNVTADGFDIVLESSATEALQFSWIALSVSNPNTTSQP